MIKTESNSYKEYKSTTNKYRIKNTSNEFEILKRCIT